MAEQNNELDVMFPDRSIQLTFKKTDSELPALHDVIVTEPRYLQGLELLRDATGLFGEFGAFHDSLDNLKNVSINDYYLCIEDHIEDWLLVLQRLSGLSVDQIGELSDQDGQILALAVLNALIPFLVRRGHLTRQLDQKIAELRQSEQDPN
ncbi:MAG: hypothetical protein CTY18_02895 [Methylomonas sp.]|nr:MAG: hypothetical protein CTY18_02895 [Methylomonas sp.]